MLPSIPKSGTMGSDAINLDLAVLTAVQQEKTEAVLMTPQSPRRRSRGLEAELGD